MRTAPIPDHHSLARHRPALATLLSPTQWRAISNPALRMTTSTTPDCRIWRRVSASRLCYILYRIGYVDLRVR